MIEFDKTYMCFLKAVQPQYADSFFNKGEIFFNTLGFYQDKEKEDSNIGDSKENIFMNLPKGFIYFHPEKELNNFDDIQHLIETGSKIPVENAIGCFKNNKDVIHCLCLSSFVIEDNGVQNRFELDPSYVVEYFGSRFFLIVEYELYLKRIMAELLRLGYDKIYFSPVEYFNKSSEFINPVGNPFKKRDKYIYQNECRILVRKDTLGSLAINIGSLSDVAIDITVLMENSIKALDKQ